MSFGVKAWKEEVMIPTYEVGEADKNPIFLDKRVYQGSTGKVYPYPVVESISDEKKEKPYQAVFLENEYLKVMILPQLGGRIQRAYDKTNDYDFVYYNHVIKPALVGLTGPWISGGIEFNWPQHHRPTTFMPVDSLIRENEDGSMSVLVNDVDRMYGTKGIASITLYPDKAYIEIKGQLYNRTAMPQTFLWWANPAVPVNDDTQSIFPPDVHAVMDHGKRDVSRFPIATGTYYKKDYSAGVDISRYKNIPVPTSYMAEKSEFDFVGGYDYGKKAGILHVADHHVSPGKKQWTWGCGDFGQAWDDNLTDEDGPYIELMTGMFTDNQPDFTWLKPFEEKTFLQYFMPYKAVGEVKNATIHAVVNMEAVENAVNVCAYATQEYADAVIRILVNGKMCFEEKAVLSPTKIYEKQIPVSYEKETDLTVQVRSGAEILVEYTPLPEKMNQLPEPAQAAKEPEEIMTNEELLLTAQHIEQYRHATYEPDQYYLEGLKRDSGDSRINNAYGLLLMRRGNYEEAEKHFCKAVERLTWKNPNPYNSEPYYHLGLVLFYQGKYQEAYDAFYKAAWSSEQQEMSFYYLAAIRSRMGCYEEALELVGKSLVKNSQNIKARGLKALLYRKLGRVELASKWIEENLLADPFDYVSRFEQTLLSGEKADCGELNDLMRGESELYLLAAIDYAEGGNFEEAISILAECKNKTPMLKYYASYYMGMLGQEDLAAIALDEAEMYSSAYCFPNKLEDIQVLEAAIRRNSTGAFAYYYLGLICYDKKQRVRATKLWEECARLKSEFPTVHRNLALVYFNYWNKKEEAKVELEKAFSLDESDARVFLELDQLYKKLEIDHKIRLDFYDSHEATYQKRDDLVIEYITLTNILGEYEKAHTITMNRKFHPWEGGEGKITTQYTVSLLELAKKNIVNKEYAKAIEQLEKALVYPRNLGEGKLEGTKDNHVYYYLGQAYEGVGEVELAKEAFQKATIGDTEPAGMMYYNDQPADMILYQGLAFVKLGCVEQANTRFYKLIDYAEKHMQDKMKIEYFAVSLPDFFIFDNDLNAQNKAHCNYLLGLGYLGLAKAEKAEETLKTALSFDANHQNVMRYLRERI